MGWGGPVKKCVTRCGVAVINNCKAWHVRCRTRKLADTNEEDMVPPTTAGVGIGGGGGGEVDDAANNGAAAASPDKT